MVKKFKSELAGDDGWTRWIQPVKNGYLMACCDCGLVHRMDFRIYEGRVQFKAQRAPRHTAKLRKQKAINKQIAEIAKEFAPTLKRMAAR